MSMKRTLSVLAVLTAMLWTAGCAPPFSRQALDQVDRNITFGELQRDPDQYKGKCVMLAGVIIDTKNTKEGTFIEVLQKPMERRGRPLETDTSEGRFMISSSQFLDAAVFHAWKRITVIGEVAGQKIQPLGELQYRYPVVTARELHLWEPTFGPRVTFGVGIYHGF